MSTELSDGGILKGKFIPTSKLPRVVARPDLSPHSAEDVVLISGQHVLVVVGQHDVAAQRIGVMMLAPEIEKGKWLVHHPDNHLPYYSILTFNLLTHTV